MFKKKPTASEVDGVQYRRAKTWQIICYACNALVGMSVYSLIGMASYSASIGYGITTATVGIILMLARILDAFTDPMLAFVYDRVNTRFGKLRVLLISGYLIEAVGLLCMFNLCSSKGFGLPVFALTYIIYIIGYTVSNMTIQTLPAIMTQITAGGIARAGSAMAVTVIMMLPPILVYMISQSNVLESMNSAGIKE